MVELKPSEYEELREVYSANEVDELTGQCQDTAAFWALLKLQLGDFAVGEIKAAAFQRRTRPQDSDRKVKGQVVSCRYC